MADREYFGWLKLSSCRIKVRVVKLYYHTDCFIAPLLLSTGKYAAQKWKGRAMLRFHDSNCYANTPQCYVTGRLPTLLALSQGSWQIYKTCGKSIFSRIRSPELF